MFQHKEEVKKSFFTAWKNKILWVFGLFLAEGYVFADMGMSQSRREAIKKIFGHDFWTNFAAVRDDFMGLVVKKYWIFAVVVLVLSLLSVMARGALLLAISDIKRGAAPKFTAALRGGSKRFWPLLGIMILFWVGNLPALIFWYAGIVKSSAVLVAIGAMIFFVYNVGLILFKHYSYCLIVFEKRGIWESIFSGWKMFVKNWRDSLFGQVVRVLATVCASLITILAAVIISITFFVLSMLVAAFAGTVGFNIVMLVGLASLFSALLFANAFLNVYVYSYLTRLFWYLKGE